MARADELLQAIEGRRRAFRAALTTAADVWQPRTKRLDEESWMPRQIAEHVLTAELGYAGAVASALGLDQPPWEVFALESAEDAVAAMARVVVASRAIMERVTVDDLPRTVPSGASVAEIMIKAADHLAEHSRQIRDTTAILLRGRE